VLRVDVVPESRVQCLDLNVTTDGHTTIDLYKVLSMSVYVHDKMKQELQ